MKYLMEDQRMESPKSKRDIYRPFQKLKSISGMILSMYAGGEEGFDGTSCCGNPSEVA